MQSVVICSDAAVLKTNLLNMFLLYVLLPRISSESDFMLEKHKFLLFQFSGILCSYYCKFSTHCIFIPPADIATEHMQNCSRMFSLNRGNEWH